MLYLQETPVILDDSKLRGRLGQVHKTPYDQGHSANAGVDARYSIREHTNLKNLLTPNRIRHILRPKEFSA